MKYRGDDRLMPMRWLGNLLTGNYVKKSRAFAAALKDKRVEPLHLENISDIAIVSSDNWDGAEITLIVGDCYIPMQWYDKTNEYVVVGIPEIKKSIV